MLSNFTLYPAIDLRQGQVVRLAQGDLKRTTVYDNDPASVAARWRALGADWLHVVNLDGAFGERGEANAQALAAIVAGGGAAGGGRVQFGGGLRDLDSIRAALDQGVTRVVIGTAAVEQPTLVDVALAEFGPERIVVG